MKKKTIIIVVSTTLFLLVVGTLAFFALSNRTVKEIEPLDPFANSITEEVVQNGQDTTEPTVVDVEFEREVTEDTSGYPYYIEDADGCITVDGEKIQKIDNGNKVTVDKETPQSSTYPSSGLSDEEIRRQFSEQIGFNVQDGSNLKVDPEKDSKYINLW